MMDDSKVRMNLAAIKKVDPYAKDIVDTSSHVAFYIFNSEQNEWEKTDVEGAFFIYSRNGQPFHSIFIINRINTTSFVEPITHQLELQTQAPFLLYRNDKSRIRGFWFYNSSECERISKVVNDLVQNLPVTNSNRNCNNGSNNNTAAVHSSTTAVDNSDNYTTDNGSIFTKLSVAGEEKISNHYVGEGGSGGDEIRNLKHSNMGNIAVKEADTTSNNSNNSNVNIFKMLSHAQEEFNNTQNNNSPKPGQKLVQTPPSAPPGITPMKGTSQSHLYPLPTTTTSQQYEQHLSNTINVGSGGNTNNNAPSGDSVMKFFAAAAKPVVEGHFTPRILPNTLSVEQLEKQQRDIVATTPKGNVSSISNSHISVTGSTTASSPYSGKKPTFEISGADGAGTLSRTNITGSGTKLSCAFLESVAIENSTAAMIAKNKTKSPTRGGRSSHLSSGNMLQQLQETSPSSSNTLLHAASSSTATNQKSLSNTSYNNNNCNNTGNNEKITSEELGFRKVVGSNNLPGERISLSNIFSNMSIQQQRPPSSKPALMPPTMFDKPISAITTNSEVTSKTSINHTGAESFIVNINDHQMQQQHNKQLLLFNAKKDAQVIAAGTEASSIMSTSLSLSQQEQQPLNKCQFIQAFTNLIQNDDDFVQKLHESYLKTVTKFGTYQ